MSVFNWLRGKATALEHRLDQAEKLGASIDDKLDTVVQQCEKFENAIGSLYERALTMEKDIGRTLDGSDFAQRIDDVATEFAKTVDGLTKEDGRIWKAVERIETRINDRLNALAKMVESLDEDTPGKSKK
jgi:predicted  nucleic acid-binding Zn-ribbon protein